MKHLPFRIAIDTAEQHPWTFQDIRADSKDGDGNVMNVQWVWKSLGRYPSGLGDYSVEGHEHLVAIERKSVDDLIGTVLGFDGRRDRFEQELKNLSEIVSVVIVEGELSNVLNRPFASQFGDKEPQVQAKIINRSIISYMQSYQVPWYFASSRRHAEVAAMRWFMRWWEKVK